MEIKAISDSNFDLVEVKTTNECAPSPHCKKHGAMNRMTKDGIWRCITTHSIELVQIGNSKGKKEIDNNCSAGCCEVK